MKTMLVVSVLLLGFCCNLNSYAADGAAPPPVPVTPPPVPIPANTPSATMGSGFNIPDQKLDENGNRINAVKIGDASIVGKNAQLDPTGQIAIVENEGANAPPAGNAPQPNNNANPDPAPAAQVLPPKPEMPPAVEVRALDTKVFDDAAPWLGLKEDQTKRIALLKKNITAEAGRLDKAQKDARAAYENAATPDAWGPAALDVGRVAKEVMTFEPQRRFAQALVLLLDPDQWAMYQDKLNSKKK